jgi:hypothetical protein
MSSIDLEPTDRIQLVDMIAKLYNSRDYDARGRRVMTETAGLGLVLETFSFHGSPDTVAGDLIGRLEMLGPLPERPTYHALGALLYYLLTLKDLPEQQSKFIAGLIVKYRLVGDYTYINTLCSKYNISALAIRPRHIGRSDLRLYISHCVPETEKLAREVLQRLRTALEADNWVFPPQDRLQPEQAWDNTLYSMMGKAHAAVILISKSTLVSEAVAREMGILTARQMDEKLKLLPVFVDVNLEDLQQATFAPWGIYDALQGIPPITGSPDEIIATVLAQLKELKAYRQPLTSLEELEYQIASLLKNIDDDQLVKVADLLQMRVPTDITGETLQILVASALWQAKALEWELALTRLAESKNSDTKTLVEWIVPSWVDPLAARWVVAAAEIGSVRRALIVNGGSPNFVGTSFIRRAYSLPPNKQLPIVFVDSVGDGASVDVHIQRIRRAIKATVLGDAGSSNDTFDDDLTYELAKRPVFVVIPGPLPDQTFLNDLLNAFWWPRFTFFLLTGATEKGAEIQLKNVILIQPPLQKDEERRALRQYMKLGGSPLNKFHTR